MAAGDAGNEQYARAIRQTAAVFGRQRRTASTAKEHQFATSRPSNQLKSLDFAVSSLG